MKRNYLILIMLLSILQINAATIVVTNTNDAGAGSLRDAISTAVSGDVVRFDPTLINTGSDTISLLSYISINKGLFIKGLYNATDTLYINGNGNTIFQLNFSGVSFPRFDVDSVVLFNAVNGLSGSSFPNLNTDIRVQNSVIKDCSNSAIVINPNQIGHNEINLKIIHSNIYNNKRAIYMLAESYQGRAKAVLDITNSYIHDNSNTGNGGGVYMYTKTGVWGYRSEIECNVTGSTFSNNSAGTDGGGIYAYAYTVANNDDAKATVNINTSTFVGNSAVNKGGAVYSKIWGSDYVDYSRVYAYYSTFINNSANTSGASVYNESNGNNSRAFNFFKSSIALTSSVGVLNYRSDGSNIITGANNIFSNSGTNSNGNQFAVTLASLNLGVLQYNGGFAPTMLPNAGSIAIDLGDPSNLSNAQNGPILGRRDVGAAESNVCNAILVNNAASVCQGSTYTFRGQILNTAGIYKDTVVNPIGCDTVFSMNLTTLSPQTANVSITLSPSSTITSGTNVIFTATDTYGGSSPVYQWKLNGNNVGINSATYSNNTLLNSDVVSCVLTSNYGCLTSTTVASNNITMTVAQNNDEPCNAILLSVNNTCQYNYFDNTTASWSSANGNHTCVLSTNRDVWFKFVANTTSDIYVNTIAGGLTDGVMSLYDANGCNALYEVGCIDDDGSNSMPQAIFTGATIGDTYYIRISGYGTTNYGTFGVCVVSNVPTASIEDSKQNDFDFSVYPNPASDVVNIEFTDEITESTQVSIYDVQGKKLYVNTQKFNNKIQLNVQELAKGMYTLSVIKGDKRVNKSIVVTK